MIAGYQVIYSGGITTIRIPTVSYNGLPSMREMRFSGQELPPHIGLDSARFPTDENEETP